MAGVLPSCRRQCSAASSPCSAAGLVDSDAEWNPRRNAAQVDNAAAASATLGTSPADAGHCMLSVNRFIKYAHLPLVGGTASQNLRNSSPLPAFAVFNIYISSELARHTHTHFRSRVSAVRRPFPPCFILYSSKSFLNKITHLQNRCGTSSTYLGRSFSKRNVSIVVNIGECTRHQAGYMYRVGTTWAHTCSLDPPCVRQAPSLNNLNSSCSGLGTTRIPRQTAPS